MKGCSLAVWPLAIGIGPDWVVPQTTVVDGARVSSAGWLSIAWDHELEQKIGASWRSFWDDPLDRRLMVGSGALAAIWAGITLATFVADRAGMLAR